MHPTSDASSPARLAPPTAALSRLRMRHLQLVIAVAETGSIRKAATRLDISQPAASELLRDVEHLFGKTLFVRSRRGITATPAAAGLLERACVILRELDLAHQELSPTRSVSAPLRIGAVSHVIHELLPPAIARLEAIRPGTRLLVREAGVEPLLGSLLGGELDCVIGRLSPGYFKSEAPSLVFWTISDVPMCVIAPPDHPLAKRRRVTMADLVAADWALLPPDGLTVRMFNQAFLRANAEPPIPKVVSDSMEDTFCIAMGARMLTLAPLTRARREQARGASRILPIDISIDLPPVAFICRRSTTRVAALMAFRDAVLGGAAPSRAPGPA